MTTKALAIPFWDRVERRGPDDCWPWHGAILKSGHGHYWYNGKNVPAHRHALKLSGVEVPDDRLACHRCNNPPCCNPAHLYSGSRSDNKQDSIKAGTSYSPHPGFGEEHPQSKLTWESVEKIRMVHGTGPSMRSLARQNGVSLAAIQKVLSGKTWRAQPSQIT